MERLLQSQPTRTLAITRTEPGQEKDYIQSTRILLAEQGGLYDVEVYIYARESTGRYERDIDNTRSVEVRA